MRRCPMSSLTFDGQTLIYQTPYAPSLVADLKLQVPASERQWDPGRKVWRVAPQHAALLVGLAQTHLGETLQTPAIRTRPMQTETRMLDLRYIGQTKERGGNERTAFGWANGAWSVILPESVLRTWFDAPRRPDEETTLYQVLAVSADSDAASLKAAYRRLARQWHPDVCKEPGATEVFRTIQHAWEILNDDRKRARYDAGLKLTATLSGNPAADRLVREMTYGYRSPLRCGLLLAEGQELLGRFVAAKILAWEDITDQYGRTLSTSWPMGADRFVEAWL